MSKSAPGTSAREPLTTIPPLETRPRPAAAKLLRLPRPFILMQIPKTGTTYTNHYVRNADLLSVPFLSGMNYIPQLSRVCKHWEHRVQAKLKSRLPYGYMNFHTKHKPYSRLPVRMRPLPAVAILREPVSWHLSDYVYRTSKNRPLRYPSPLKKLRNPQYEAFVQKYMGGEVSIDAWCNLSLEGHWHFRRDVMRRWRTFNDSTLAADFPIGACGCHALLFLHRDPDRVFAMHAEEAEDYFASGRWRQDLCQAYFLRHEQLREDLYSVMLKQLGYRRKALDAALEITPVRANRSPDQRRERALQELEQKPWLREEILRYERIYSQYILPLAGNFRDE